MGRAATWVRTGRDVAELGLRLGYRAATMGRRVVPNAFVLGPPRSGTSSLDSYLRQHPSYRPPLIKEVGYNYEQRRRPHGELLGGIPGGLPRPLIRPVIGVLQGLFYIGGDEGYRKVFPLQRHMERAARQTGAALTADSTVFGLYERDTADAFPYALAGDDCRFITILRSPAEFLHSFYRKEIGRRFYPVDPRVSFGSFLRAPRSLYTDERATAEIQRRMDIWRPAFEERDSFDPETFNFALGLVCYSVFVKAWLDRVGDRLLVLSFSDLRDRTRQTLDRVFDHLRLPSHHVVDLAARNVGAYGASSLSAEDASFIESVCRPYNEELYGLLGRDLGW